jgi:hypothetical protein
MACIGPEEQGLREASQLVGGNMGTGCGPIRSLWAVYREGGWVCLATSTPEDGGSMFLRNVGIGLQIHTAPKPRISTTT